MIQLPRVRAPFSGVQGVELGVAVDGLPAAPFLYSGAVYQTPVLVWMQP